MVGAFSLSFSLTPFCYIAFRFANDLEDSNHFWSWKFGRKLKPNIEITMEKESVNEIETESMRISCTNSEKIAAPKKYTHRECCHCKSIYMQKSFCVLMSSVDSFYFLVRLGDAIAVAVPAAMTTTKNANQNVIKYAGVYNTYIIFRDFSE